MKMSLLLATKDVARQLSRKWAICNFICPEPSAGGDVSCRECGLDLVTALLMFINTVICATVLAN